MLFQATFQGMLITVNGETCELPDGLTVSGLLEHYRLKPGGVVVELNLEVPGKDAYSRLELKAGDRVEIVKFMGGG